MRHSINKKYAQNFYEWSDRYTGHRLHETHVPVYPRYVPFHYFQKEVPGTFEDGRVISTWGWVSQQAKKILQAAASKKIEAPAAPSMQIPAREHYTDTFRIFLPQEIKYSTEALEQCILILSNQKCPFAFEITATHTSIQLHITCPDTATFKLQTLLKNFFPHSSSQKVHYCTPAIPQEGNIIAITDLGLNQEFVRPIAQIQQLSIDPFVSLFSSFEQLHENETAIIQMLFQKSTHNWKENILRSVTNEIRQPFFYNAPEMLPTAKEKAAYPLFGVILRIAGQAHTELRATQLTESIAETLIHSTASSVNQLSILSNEGYATDIHREDFSARKSRRDPMVLTIRELLSILHFPYFPHVSQKYSGTNKKTKALSAICESHPFILGINEHEGISKTATLSRSQHMRHAIIFGGSGMGKSNLQLSMILEDCRLGNGIALVDPHGALVDKLLAYIPEHRMNDVIIVDPSDHEFPTAMNILKADSDIEKEVLASDLVAAFRKNSLTWGNSLNSIFANAIAVFLYSTRGGTLADVRRFLLDKHFRNIILETVQDPQLVYYWQHEFPLLRTSSVGAILTRLDSFLRPKAIRNMVAQSGCLNFKSILSKQKILLIKLNIGSLGTENAALLGSLFITKLYQAAIARQAAETLTDFTCYADEVHHFLSSATSITDILSGTRKFHFSLIAATQSLSQISDPFITDSFLTNAATRICFRLGEQDAKKMAEGFSFFTQQDLQRLRIGEAIVRVDGPENDFSLQTSLIEKEQHGEEIIHRMIEASREKYCIPKHIVEETLLQSISSPFDNTTKEKSSTKKRARTSHTATEEIHSVIDDTPYISQQEKRETPQKVRGTQPTRHRDVQALIKRMAESFGYTATIEQQLPEGNGQVDVLLKKDTKTIAVEISVTTGKKWEVHNIVKCIKAHYDVVVSLSENEKQVAQIKKQFEAEHYNAAPSVIRFFTPLSFFEFLSAEIATSTKNRRVRGYQVNVSYEQPAVGKEVEEQQKIDNTNMDTIHQQLED